LTPCIPSLVFLPAKKEEKLFSQCFRVCFLIIVGPIPEPRDKCPTSAGDGFSSMPSSLIPRNEGSLMIVGISFR